MSLKRFTPILAAVFLVLSVPAEAAGRNQQPQQQYVAPLSGIEMQDLTYMREEEKLARDVYVALYEKWGLTPFANISASEQQHMDALLQLLRKYRLPDPAAGTAIGEFGNASLQTLYDTLLEQGSRAAVDALRVGGLIEETDILDLVATIEHADHADIDTVYGNLQCGSRNHLRAFAAQYTAFTGQPYLSQVLGQKYVDDILASGRERCGR